MVVNRNERLANNESATEIAEVVVRDETVTETTSGFNEQTQTALTREFQEFGANCMEHKEILFKHAMRLCGNPDTAEDLVSITIRKALTNFLKFDRHRGTLKTWLFVILRNTSISEHGRMDNSATEPLNDKKLRTTPADPTSLRNEILESIFGQLTSLETETPIESIDQILEQNLHRLVSQPVAEALRCLSPKYRSLVLLRICFDLSYKEMTAILCIPKGSVMSGLSKAKAQLRANIEVQDIAYFDYGLAA